MIHAKNSEEVLHLRRPENVLLEAAIIAVVFLIVGVLHHVIPHTSVFWHNFFQWLYYGLAPTVISAAWRR